MLIFDLRKIFAVPKDFLKSKIYCTVATEDAAKNCFNFLDLESLRNLAKFWW